MSIGKQEQKEENFGLQNLQIISALEEGPLRGGGAGKLTCL